MSITILEDGVERPGTAEEVAEHEARAAIYASTLPSRTAQAQIELLESQITNRRMRDHALGTGGDWLSDQEALIAVEREKL
jgi:hypothetical protein